MINVLNLNKSFVEKKVLDNLTFSISKGEIFGFLGPNGAGKTTTINILCGLLNADNGSIQIKGKTVNEGTKCLLGFVPQEISLYKDLTVRENLNFFARIYGLKCAQKNERIAELIDVFNLQEYKNTEIARLSGGWQRRVNIAVALVHSPELLILDEPTAGVDVEARYELWELISKLRDKGVTILLTTHQLEEAEKLCSKIAILNEGKIAAEGSMSQLRKIIPAEELAVIEAKNEDAVCQKAKSLGWDYRYYGKKLTILLPKRYDLKNIVEFFNGIPLVSISLRHIGLEHVYFEVFHKQAET